MLDKGYVIQFITINVDTNMSDTVLLLLSADVSGGSTEKKTGIKDSLYRYRLILLTCLSTDPVSFYYKNMNNNQGLKETRSNGKN